MSGFSLYERAVREGKTTMFSTKNHDQTILEFSQGDYIVITAESFLIDRQAGELSPHTLRFYRQFLTQFFAYCEANTVRFIREVTPEFLRRYFLAFAENHNPGGVHASYRTIRAYFHWIAEEEIMPPDWKSPMKKVRAPKVHIVPLEPIGIHEVQALIANCQHDNFFGDRDRAIFLFLLDTGVRAQELCNTNIKDLDLNTGSVLISHGKGGKSRMVFIGRKTRKAIRFYLRMRQDLCPALFVSKDGERLTYDGLNQILDRRAKTAELEKKPTLHGFRRAFALNMLRSGVDVFTLQRLMGHTDLQVLRRYLAQNDQDNQLAHARGGPVDNLLVLAKRNASNKEVSP